MSTQKISFTDGIEVNITEEAATIRTRQKWNWATIIIGTLLAIPSILMTPLVPFFGLFAVAMIVLIFQSNRSALFPVSILDFKNKTFTKFPGVPFLRKRQIRFNKAYDMAFLVKAVSGYTSAYEEGNTDFRKSLVLETDQGEIRIAKYISRNEDLEEPAQQFAAQIREKLITKNDE